MNPDYITIERSLSPRVRGNHRGPLARFHIGESIPACAGEPEPRCWRSWGPQVYPRVCGGTPDISVTVDVSDSLSPRVRGNRDDHEAQHEHERLSPRVRGNRGRGETRRRAEPSIPACAGEPIASSPWDSCESVYPRVCGGTGRRIAQTAAPRVYPRVCGGTDFAQWTASVQKGLSPRVRGNRHHRVAAQRPRRSIPACAGEPTPG